MIETIRANPGTYNRYARPAHQRRSRALPRTKPCKSVKRCVIMGGNPCCEGNVTPAAEFNI